MHEQKIMITHHIKYSTIRVLKDNRNEKKSIEASYSSADHKAFYTLLVFKLENVIINRIHSFTSLRGAFNRMFSFGLQIDSPRKQTFLLAHREGEILLSESSRYG